MPGPDTPPKSFFDRWNAALRTMAPRRRGIFANTSGEEAKGVIDVLKWQLQFARALWPREVQNTRCDPVVEAVESDKVGLHFINHSSFLIQLGPINILVDPVFSERTSPVQWLGPRRVRRPGFPKEQLPRIDLVLLSHNHYDHMDMPFLQWLSDRQECTFLVALGDGKLMFDAGITKVHEFDWWESFTFGVGQDAMTCTFTEVQHFSGRSVHDRNRSLWGGWMIDSPQGRIYFAGDTGAGPHFKTTTEKLGAPDLSLLPIGAYEPRWFMRNVHMNPDDAVRAHLELESKLSVGMHWGTFQLTDEAIDQPEIDLAAAIQSRRLTPDSFLLLEPGERRVFDLVATRSCQRRSV
jgi:L-ascorbate metabolism protein UlaG (beta-lactamase superfamily)